MSNPGLVPFIETRTSAQSPSPGTLKVDNEWYRSYLRRSPLAVVHGWEAIPRGARKERAQCAFPFDLSEDVLCKIANLDLAGIKRLVNLVLAFEDIFLFADPEYFPVLVMGSALPRFMRWAISTDVYHPGEATRQWKKFTVVVKWKASVSRTPAPEKPNAFPGLPRDTPEIPSNLPAFWCRLAPWLAPIWRDGATDKPQCTKLAHFVTSRNLPAGTKRDRAEALETHATVLCGDTGPSEPGRTELLEALARHAGLDIAVSHKVKLDAAHCSLTNSASLECGINNGGRASSVRGKFREWLMHVPSHNEDGLTWFGVRYWLKAGIPRWRTMCRPALAVEGRPGDSAPIEQVDFTPGKYRYEDPLYCLDKYTGYQLLQWSIEEGIAQQVIHGPPSFKEGEEIRLGRREAAIRASAIGEPGGKSRVVTVGEDWLTILLQPLAHALLSILRLDPSARAGLGRAWQGFEYTKSWSTKDAEKPPMPGERFILTSDLTTATDYCPHGYSRALLRGFTKGLGLDSPFTRLWIELLVSPRHYTAPIERYVDHSTLRGVLMGDPGTKLVLSLFNKAAEMEAMLRYTNRTKGRLSCRQLVRHLDVHGVPNSRYRLFAFAGDDHIAIGPPEYLRAITRAHISNGMKVSESSNFISDRLGFYCEEIIFIGNRDVWKCWGNKTPLFKQPYADNPHVDALKLRLFSLCSKEHEGKNETNPAIGMSQTLRGMIAWFAEGWEAIRVLSTLRFAQKMRRLLPTNIIIRGLNRQLGGCGAPAFGYSADLLNAHWERIPILHRKAIHLVRNGEPTKVHPLRRVLSSVTSMTSLRGIASDSIEEQVRQVLSSELCQAKTVEQLRPDRYTELEWSNMRLMDKFQVVEREGKFITIGEAIQVVMRPYVFRDLLFPEESIAHGIDPDRKRSYRQLSWPVRLNRLQAALDRTFREHPELEELSGSITEEDLRSTRDQIIESFEQDYLASAPKEIIVIPREVVYTDKLCTLRTDAIKLIR
nr:RNA-dependent RNA polymerase [Narnavirus sp.]